jgi:hypothetical protein
MTSLVYNDVLLILAWSWRKVCGSDYQVLRTGSPQLSHCDCDTVHDCECAHVLRCDALLVCVNMGMCQWMTSHKWTMPVAYFQGAGTVSWTR